MADQGCVWLVVHSLSVQHRLYASSVCDMNSAAAAAVCGFWRYTSVICLCLCVIALSVYALQPAAQ